jgi:hypothetical protein
VDEGCNRVMKDQAKWMDGIIVFIAGATPNKQLKNQVTYDYRTGMKIYFMVIIFILLTLDIRLQIARIIKEMFKQEVPMWLHVTLSVKNVINMDR